ncbi:MAG: DUF4446 family protein [Parcubacteria group bacterium]|nr:DUF4446 family protein [Parcubacteria group bacterium]
MPSIQLQIVFFVLSIIVTLANIILFAVVWRLRKRFQAFINGGSVKDLEMILMGQLQKITQIDEDLLKLAKEKELIQKMAVKSIQRVGMVRFNPFANTGGDQSFCVALLDHENNGCVLTSLYSRDGIRVYGKPVEFGRSSYALSEEEQSAIAKAISN